MREIVMLAILDGWGVGKKDEGNPLYMAKKPALSFIEENFPCGALQASGTSVGLPWENASSSEVGHLVMGAGKVIYQNYPKISLSIRDGSFFENAALVDLVSRAKGSSALHLVGTLSDRAVRSAKEHLFAIVELAGKIGVKRIFAHIILDGRKNNSPASSEKLLAELQGKLSKANGAFSTISGAYYGMNEAGEPKNASLFLGALTGNASAPMFRGIQELLAAARARGPKDELFPPSALEGGEPIKPGDAVLFFNFEGDGLKPAAEALMKTEGVSVGTLTDYGLKTAIAFPKDDVRYPLGRVLADSGKSQMRIAESERYRSLTFYFNGEREEPFQNEYRAMIPSKHTLSPAEHPEMMAETVTERALMTLRERGFDFVALNYANPDVIASTGSYAATKRMAEIVDGEIGKLLSAALQENHTLIVVGSHGNAEMLLDVETGEPDTRTNPNPVPFYLVKSSLRKASPEKREKLPSIGLLSDVAPTILELMNIKKPEEMTGESLLGELQ